MSSSHFLLLLASWPRTHRREPSLGRTCGSTRSVLHGAASHGPDGRPQDRPPPFLLLL